MECGAGHVSYGFAEPMKRSQNQKDEQEFINRVWQAATWQKRSGASEKEYENPEGQGKHAQTLGKSRGDRNKEEK